LELATVLQLFEVTTCKWLRNLLTNPNHPPLRDSVMILIFHTLGSRLEIILYIKVNFTASLAQQNICAASNNSRNRAVTNEDISRFILSRCYATSFYIKQFIKSRENCSRAGVGKGED
jgi:hypothetical protein